VLDGEQVARFKAGLPELRYSDLDVRDKGIVDHFLQTKILKWEEVDRVVRMGHPIFVEYFEKLRDAIFPSIADVKEVRWQARVLQTVFCGKDVTRRAVAVCVLVPQDVEAMLDAQATRLMWKALKVDHPELLKTKQPFYVEDYAYWFNKTKETSSMPDVRGVTAVSWAGCALTLIVFLFVSC
jgi:hypothetical protein